MADAKYRRRAREQSVPPHFRAWFEGGGDVPLEVLVDLGTRWARLARIYATWCAEDPRRRREPLQEFLRRVGVKDSER
jgi:hypothetical protein